MILNEKKNCFGMFSNIGRKSSVNIIIHKEPENVINKNEPSFHKTRHIVKPKVRILNQNQVDIFSPNYIPDKKKKKEVNQNLKRIREFYQLFSYDTKIVKRKRNNSNKDIINNKYADRECINKLTETPPCTKYNPKFDFVRVRTATSVDYNKSIRSTPSRKKNDEPFRKFYLSNDIFGKNSKSFINMAKMTKRKKLYIKTDTFSKQISNKFGSRISSNVNSPDINSKYSLFNGKRKIMLPSLTKSNFLTTNNNLTTTITREKTSPNVQTKIIFSESNKDLLNQQSFTSVNKSFSSQHCLSVPDFKKTLPRNVKKKINAENKIRIPYKGENSDEKVYYNPRSFVNYSLKNTKIRDKNILRTKVFNNLTNSLPDTFDADKILYKINNYSKPKDIDFNKMISRVIEKKDPLPCFMKKIYGRISADTISAEALKMNCFSESKIFINRNQNKTKENNKNKEELDERLKFLEQNKRYRPVEKYIKKRLNFYNKNLDYVANGKSVDNFVTPIPIMKKSQLLILNTNL